MIIRKIFIKDENQKQRLVGETHMNSLECRTCERYARNLNLGEKYFITWRKGSHHFMRKYVGFGISKEVLEGIINKSILYIKLIYTGANQNIMYEVLSYYWWKKGIVEQNPPFEKQIFLSENSFDNKQVMEIKMS